MAKLTCSIAMCTYNGEPYLQEQLDSLAKQTHLPDELIVCDDGSKDTTCEILEHFAATAPFPVRVVRNESNLGFRRNFEKCTQLCTQDVVFFCDQDDIWCKDKIARFMAEFEREPQVGLVMSDTRLMNGDGQLQDCLLSQTMHFKASDVARLVKRDPVGFPIRYYITWLGMATAFRRSLADILYPYSPSRGHDLWTVWLLSAITQVRFLPEPLVHYRRHDHNVSEVSKEQPTISTEIQKARNPGVANYYQQVSVAMNEVAQRLEQYPNRLRDPKAIQRYRRKGEFYARRYQIHTKQISKLWGILAETFNGNYFRYAKGLKSIATDFLS